MALVGYVHQVFEKERSTARQASSNIKLQPKVLHYYEIQSVEYWARRIRYLGEGAISAVRVPAVSQYQGRYLLPCLFHEPVR